MSKLLLILLCLPFIGFGQQTYVPDDNFEAYLEANGMGNGIANDDYVTTTNVSSLTILNIGWQNIADLTGIEDFISLTELKAELNQLTNIDISNLMNLTLLKVEGNQLTSLDVSQNIALTELNCRANQLTSIDLSNNSALYNVEFSFNQLTNIDFSNNPALYRVDCTDNQLISLDFSNNPALWWLEVDNNNISTLNINGCVNLFSIMINNNQLTSINLSTNTNLIQMYCVNNQIDTLDFSYCTAQFGILEATNNNLSYLNLQNGHLVAEVWVQNNPNLTCILIDSNEVINNFQLDPQHYFSVNCGGATAIEEHSTNKELLKVTDLLGKETKQTNQPLFYIYDDGTVEKRIVIE